MDPPLFHRYAALLARRRGVFIVGFTVLCLVILAGALRLRVDFSARAFFGSDGDETEDLERFQAAFGPDDNLLVLVVERAGEQTLVHPDAIGWVRAATTTVAKAGGVDRVESFATLALPVTDAIGTLVFAPVVPAPPPTTPLEIAALHARLKLDPIVTPTFLSDDGKIAAIAVLYGLRPGAEGFVDTDDIAAVRTLLDDVMARVDAVPRPDGITVRPAGMPAVRTSLLGLILGDQVLFVPLSFGLMALLLALLYRRFHGVLLPLFAASLPSALVMGIMGYLGEPIGVVNQVYFTLLPVIAVSGALHLLSRYYTEAREGGVDHDTLLPHNPIDAVVRALGEVGTACFLSALTTMVGLASLLLSSMPILRSFGLYSSIGVTLAFVTLVVPVPLILTLTRGRVVTAKARMRAVSTDRLLEHCADVTLNRPRLSIAASVALLVAAIAAGQLVVVDTSLHGMLAPDHPTTKAGRVVDEQLSGLIALELFLEGRDGAFTDPRALQVLVDVERDAREKSAAIRATASLGALVARLNEALVGVRELPAARETAAQLLFLAEGNPTLDDLVRHNASVTRVQLRLVDVGAQKLSALAATLVDDTRRLLDERLGGDHGIRVTATGTALTTYAGVARLASDLKLSLFSAFLVIIVILTIALRSLRLGLLAMLPNALPIALGYALLGVMGWPLEPGPAVALCVALGIAVDDTIHLLVAVREGRQRGLLVEAAMRTALVRTGRPVVFTTIILAAGFGVNALSSFPTNARVGVIGAFVIAVALLADLFVLPPLVLVGSPDRPEGSGNRPSDGEPTPRADA